MRMARAAAEEASAARARFVAIVSHEIRTPLNALLNSLLLLAEGEMVPPQRMLLDVARQSGDALLALINDILDMSRLEAGQLSLRRSVFALRPLLTGAMEIMRPLAARRGITLQLAIRPDVPHLLFSDAVRLRQVLLNMLSNAAKYAAPGEVLLTAEASGDKDETPHEGEADGAERAPTLRLAVRDQGPAILDAERARLFQPFSQLDQPGAEVQPGSGLGLAICRLLATLMGGTVGCDMVELAPMGQPRRTGNEFWLSLPVTPLPADAVTSPERPVAGLPMLPHSRLLLVEDVIASRVVVARLLRRVGHLVDTAASGEEAIAAVMQHPYDAVLMDVHMPGISGIDAARQIRMLPGAAGAVPMIALTATVSPEETLQCRAAGMEGLVTKPAALADLLAEIGRYAWPGRGFGGVAGGSRRGARGAGGGGWARGCDGGWVGYRRWDLGGPGACRGAAGRAAPAFGAGDAGQAGGGQSARPAAAAASAARRAGRGGCTCHCRGRPCDGGRGRRLWHGGAGGAAAGGDERGAWGGAGGCGGGGGDAGGGSGAGGHRAARVVTDRDGLAGGGWGQGIISDGGMIDLRHEAPFRHGRAKVPGHLTRGSPG